MSDTPALNRYELPKALGHELVENLSVAAPRAAIGLISFWLLEMVIGYLPLPFGWARHLPGLIAIGIFCFALMSQRSGFKEAMARWRYVAAFGIVFWLGTVFQALYPR